MTTESPTTKGKHLHDWKKSELLKLPLNNDGLWYSSLLVIPERRKHESGWAWITLVGLVDEVPTHIIGHCDDLAVFDEFDHSIKTGRSIQPHHIRFDATYPAGVLHLWVRGTEMRVDGYSSTTVRYRKKVAA